MREWLAGVVGENLAPVVSVILAAAVVILLALVLIGLAKRVFSGTGGIGSRSRAPRLAVLDVTAIDPKRKLVLVRRDEVEHLLLIGGQNDLVVEPMILRGQVPRRPRVEGAAPRREPELSRDAPAERVAPPVPPRRVPSASAPETLAGIVELPVAEPVAPVSTAPRDTTSSRQRAAARAELPAEASVAPRVEVPARPVEPDRFFPAGVPALRDEDALAASKPGRDLAEPIGSAMSSPAADGSPYRETVARPPADGRPAWMMATPEAEERPQTMPDVVSRPVRTTGPVEDARAFDGEDGEPAKTSTAPIFAPPPERSVAVPPSAPQARPEPSGSGVVPAPSSPMPNGATPPASAPARSMATPTLPVPVRAPTLPLPPLPRPEASSPATSGSARSLWAPAPPQPTPEPRSTVVPEAVPADRAPPSAGSGNSLPGARAGFEEAPEAGSALLPQTPAESVRSVPATVRGGHAPFPAAPGPGAPASTGSGLPSTQITPTQAGETDGGRQPLSVRSFATTIQERRTAPAAPAEPRPVPTTPMATPVLPSSAPGGVAGATASFVKAEDTDKQRIEPAATAASTEPAGLSEERETSQTGVRPLTLEEEMERLLHDFTIDVSDRR